MVVDDSVVARGLVSRWVSAMPGFELAGLAANGRIALDSLDACQPDIVLLDLAMPELDGLATLPLLLQRRPDLTVIVMSTLTQRNAESTLRCLSLGALDCLPKPAAQQEMSLGPSFRDELTAKLAGLAGRGRRAPVAVAADPHALRRALAPASGLRAHCRCLAIGASTGGPRALSVLLGSLEALSERVPILVVQHMPPIFTAVLADHLRAETGLAIREARHDEPLLPGRVYIAPGGRHMGVSGSGRLAAIRLSDEEPVRHCRPAVDILLRDVAQIFGPAALSVILTGMGADGTEGARQVVAGGGAVLVQDEASSVVWGMPGSVARAGTRSRNRAARPDGWGDRAVRAGRPSVRAETLTFFAAFLKARSGLHLGPEKAYLLESRLATVARAAGAACLDDLAIQLGGTRAPGLESAVVNAMTTNETSFFRDRAPFDTFRATILPRLIAARADTRRLRFWSAAASTGQEAYSLAMLVAETPALHGWSVEIVGTDISDDAIGRAKAGVYSQFEVQRGLPIARLLRHFTQTAEGWAVSPGLRAAVEFRAFNLLGALDRLGVFDAILCRNLLIYLDGPTRADLLARMRRQLAPDGRICLGSAEAVTGLTRAFTPDPEAQGWLLPVPAAT
jgi:two-component system chemotaxis response regulator CheB